MLEEVNDHECAGAPAILSIDDLTIWAAIEVAVALVMSLTVGFQPETVRGVDRRDLAAVGVFSVGVVGAFRLAFSVFTVDNVLGLSL